MRRELISLEGTLATRDLLLLQQSIGVSKMTFSFSVSALQVSPDEGWQSWAHFMPDQSAYQPFVYTWLLRELQNFWSIHGNENLQHWSIVSYTFIDAGARWHFGSEARSQSFLQNPWAWSVVTQNERKIRMRLTSCEAKRSSNEILTAPVLVTASFGRVGIASTQIDAQPAKFARATRIEAVERLHPRRLDDAAALRGRLVVLGTTRLTVAHAILIIVVLSVLVKVTKVPLASSTVRLWISTSTRGVVHR